MARGPEGKFQDGLKDTLSKLFPTSIIMKVKGIQGIPDLLVLYKNKWALLECKRSSTAIHRPNQDRLVELCNKMSFSSFIFPENKEEVLNRLIKFFNE